MVCEPSLYPRFICSNSSQCSQCSGPLWLQPHRASPLDTHGSTPSKTRKSRPWSTPKELARPLGAFSGAEPAQRDLVNWTSASLRYEIGLRGERGRIRLATLSLAGSSCRRRTTRGRRRLRRGRARVRRRRVFSSVCRWSCRPHGETTTRVNARPAHLNQDDASVVHDQLHARCGAACLHGGARVLRAARPSRACGQGASNPRSRLPSPTGLPDVAGTHTRAPATATLRMDGKLHLVRSRLRGAPCGRAIPSSTASKAAGPPGHWPRVPVHRSHAAACQRARVNSHRRGVWCRRRCPRRLRAAPRAWRSPPTPFTLWSTQSTPRWRPRPSTRWRMPRTPSLRRRPTAGFWPPLWACWRAFSRCVSVNTLHTTVSHLSQHSTSLLLLRTSLGDPGKNSTAGGQGGPPSRPYHNHTPPYTTNNHHTHTLGCPPDHPASQPSIFTTCIARHQPALYPCTLYPPPSSQHARARR